MPGGGRLAVRSFSEGKLWVESTKPKAVDRRQRPPTALLFLRGSSTQPVSSIDRSTNNPPRHHVSNSLEGSRCCDGM